MEWINVSDRLPDVGVRVICYSPRLGVRLGKKLPSDITEKVGIRPDGCLGFDEDVTHWMEVPREPNEDLR